MQTIDEKLENLAAWAADQADVLNDCLRHEGPLKGIRQTSNGDWWAVFETEECNIQDILDLAKMLSREKQL